MSHPKLILGLDGGGTKTVAEISALDADPTEPSLGRGVAGPSNVRSEGIAVATSNLDHAIQMAFDSAGIKRTQCVSACLGLAGADRDDEKSQILSWAESRDLAVQVQVVNDALPLLYAGTPNGIGVALISGTGSFAFARDPSGSTFRCGGWGYLFGDEGSAYSIALAGLRQSAKSVDGRGPKTDLVKHFLQHWSLKDPSEFNAVIYEASMNRSKIAGLSKIIFAAAEEGDDVARQIIEQSTEELAQMVLALIHQTKIPFPLPLALGGGILLHHSTVVSGLQSKLIAAGIGSVDLNLVLEPVFGALRMARLSITES